MQELLVDPLPQGAKREGALYPDGVHITDLKVVRETLYKMQRPAISPDVRIIPLSFFLFTLLITRLVRLARIPTRLARERPGAVP